jgi:beta-lactam-binding protein with PASTA domain
MILRVKLAFWPTFARFFNRLFGGIAMVVVTLVFAFGAMRLAIHGGQVEVPNLAGMTVSDANKNVGSRGLNLVLVNRFYSTTVPAGHIISQTPSPGVIVRHEWEIRAIESLGPQEVSIPDVDGMTERPAAMAIRRVSLDLGTVAHLPAPGEPEVVLAQTPPPNAGGIDSPRVSLLLSQKDDVHSAAFVMPSLGGLTYASASSRIAGLGLYVILTAAPDTSSPAANATPSAPATGGTVVAQTPAAGHRVVRGEGVRLTLN